MHPLHHRAIELCQHRRKLESEIIDVLSEIDRQKIYKFYGHTSLFNYAVRALKLPESTAYQFISVMRKARECPALTDALRDQTISVAKASRIVAALEPENAESVVDFAIKHSCRETDREVARLKPQVGNRDRVKVLSDSTVRVEFSLSKDVFEKLERIKALQPDVCSWGELVGRIVEDYLERKDPVRKARRQLSKPQSEKQTRPNTHTKNSPPRLRKPLTAEQKHRVFARDGGRCTHVGSDEKRCENTRWLHIHHIRSVSCGGGNNPENLTTLCSAHHDLVHQMSLPLDGQLTWLREPVIKYG